jgi:hypothetical protein
MNTDKPLASLMRERPRQCAWMKETQVIKSEMKVRILLQTLQGKGLLKKP